MIAALYVDENGPYPALLGVDSCWGVSRDATLYQGPWPVVAHPPCGPYSKQRHNYRGSEHDCAPRAVEQVRTFGGVLEHPAGSLLWSLCGLPLPGAPADQYGGFTLEVSQVEWGHVARKRTWIYLVGVPREKIPGPPFPGRQPTHWCSGNRRNKTGGSVPAGIKVCSAQQRRRTPLPFAEWLVGLAQAVELP